MYGNTWLQLSLSHMASMSPVIIKVSGLFGSRSYEKIVVSRVLGRVFVKSLCKFLFLKLEKGREGGRGIVRFVAVEGGSGVFLTYFCSRRGSHQPSN